MTTSQTQRPLRWHDVRWWLPIAALLLALHAWLALSAVEHKGPTYDEPLHLVSGYTYWRLHDYRMQPENGNLPQRWAGATMMADATPPKLPALSNSEWMQTQYGLFCETFDYYTGNTFSFYLFRARAAMLVFSVGLGLIVFAYSKHLWGPAGGCFSLALYCLSPSFLANAPLVTSDLCAAFSLWLATIAYWWSLQTPSWRRTLVSGLALGLACVAKFSVVLLGPIFLILMVLAVILGQGGSGTATRRSLRLFGLALVQILIAWVVIWAFLGWHYGAANPQLPALENFVTPWPELYTRMDPHLVGVVAFLRDHHLFPEAYLYGFSTVVYYAKYRNAFLDGMVSVTGWWYFFPLAFAMKTALSTLCAFAMSSVIAGRMMLAKKKEPGAFRAWSKKWSLLVAPLVVFFVIYWVFAVTSNLDIGQRHILPTYVPLFILAGILFHRRAHRLIRILAAVFLLGLAVESFSVRPNYLSFFNQLYGGPSKGYQHLVDSSLDWGQELPALSDWLHENRKPHEPLYFAYFGIDLPSAYADLADARLIFRTAYSHLPFTFYPLQGGLYCVSATSLQLVYRDRGRDWTDKDETDYQELRRDIITLPIGKISPTALVTMDQWRFARLCIYLRTLKPVAMIGNGILVYRLTDQEIDTTVQGSWDNLSKLIRQERRTP